MVKKALILASLSLSPLMVNSMCEVDKIDCSEFSLSPAIGYYSYREPGLMSIKGPSIALDGSYQYIERNRITLMIEGQLGFVNGKYDGRLNDKQQTPFQMNNDNSFIFGISPRIGYLFQFPKVLITVTPFLGLGYRYLNNDTSNDSHGYLRASNYFYIPIGLQFTWLHKKLVLESKLEFDYLIRGIQYSSVDGGIVNQQREGWGANGNILLGRNQGSWMWLIGPYIRYWKIQTSDIANGNAEKGWYEPENNTLGVGVMAKFVF